MRKLQAWVLGRLDRDRLEGIAALFGGNRINNNLAASDAKFGRSIGKSQKPTNRGGSDSRGSIDRAREADRGGLAVVGNSNNVAVLVHKLGFRALNAAGK